MAQNNKNNGLTQNIGIIEKLAYGSGDAASNIIWASMGAFLLFYYTDVVKVSAAAIGTIMLVSRILDGITDIIMGIIVDRTESKYGKARPWILRMALPFGIAAVLLFSVPDASEMVKLVYIFVTYNIVNLIYTAINIPYGVLSSRMTQDQYQRSVLNIFRAIFSSVINLTITGLTLPLVNALGGTPRSWGLAFAIFGTISSILFFITFFFTKERVGDDIENTDGKKEVIPVKEGIKALIKNKYWLIMTAAGALSGIEMTLLMGMNTYYAQYVLKDVNIASSLMVLLGLPMLLGLFILAPIVKRLGKRNTMIMAWTIILISYLLVMFDPTSIAIIKIACVVRGFGFASFMGVQFAMIADTVEYGEWRTGLRTEGLVFSAQSFGGKFGTGLGGAVVGWILAYGGYIGGAATQASSAVSSIKVLYFVLPAAIAVAQILLMIPYKLDKEYEGIVEQINSRKIMKME